MDLLSIMQLHTNLINLGKLIVLSCRGWKRLTKSKVILNEIYI